MRSILAHIILILVFSCSFSLLFSQSYQIGIITDFDTNPDLSEVLDALQTEIKKTVGQSYDIQFDPGNILHSDGQVVTAANHYKTLIERTDIILVLGAISLRGALNQVPLAKPTLALGVFAPEIQGVPYTEAGTSGLSNFSYAYTEIDIERELRSFLQVGDLKNISLLFDQRTSLVLESNSGRDFIGEIEERYGVEVRPVFIGEKVESALNQISEETDGVLLSLPYERTQAEIEEIAEALIERSLPSYSINSEHVELGILASNGNANYQSMMLRKLAVMVDDLLRGEELANMTVDVKQPTEMWINILTARKINFYPSFDLLFTSKIIGIDQDPDLRVYKLEEIIQLGLNENLTIKINNQDVALAYQDVKEAKSQFLPDVDLSGTVVQINAGRTNAAFGQAEGTVTGTGTLSQLIFSEQALANIKIRQYLKEAQDEATRQAVIDVVLDCYSAYFNVLRAKTNQNIRNENLESSKKNLELARIRAGLGSSSNSDIYRWESEVANGRQALVEAQTQLILAKVQLNVLLNNALGEEYEIADIALNDEIFQSFAQSALADFVQGPFEFGQVVDFLTEEAHLNFPTKKQLEANMAAVRRQETMNKRLFYTPTLAFQGQYDNVLNRYGSGSEPFQGNEFPTQNWSLALSLSYPIFDGNRRRINLDRTYIQKDQLQQQLDQLDLNLSLNVRAKALQLLSTGTNIRFSRTAAENAEKNFDIVQRSYQEGAVNIITLLDAQNASLQAKQAYALSIYNYLVAFFELENSIGFYTMMATPEEIEDFRVRFTQSVLED